MIFACHGFLICVFLIIILVIIGINVYVLREVNLTRCDQLQQSRKLIIVKAKTLFLKEQQ